MSNKSKVIAAAIDELFCPADIDEHIDTNAPIDWEQLDMITDNMTSLVLSNNFTKKFQTSPFGNYFHDSIYDQSKGKSPFHDMTSVHGFTLLMAFKYNDINFDLDSNPIASYAKQFEEISDIYELTFIFECSFHDADLRKVKSQEDVYLEIQRSNTTAIYSSNLLDIDNIVKLNNRLWNSPDYCTTVREKVIYFIFEEDYILKETNIIIDFEKIVKDYKGTQQLIKDQLMVKEMEKNLMNEQDIEQVFESIGLTKDFKYQHDLKSNHPAIQRCETYRVSDDNIKLNKIAEIDIHEAVHQPSLLGEFYLNFQNDEIILDFKIKDGPLSHYIEEVGKYNKILEKLYSAKNISHQKIFFNLDFNRIDNQLQFNNIEFSYCVRINHPTIKSKNIGIDVFKLITRELNDIGLDYKSEHNMNDLLKVIEMSII